ncbi:AMP-binding protein [Variovorax paradoxus]|uniref:AMP-binding protein n=1 Tax=Variovorax paradoxus TaxID=34073 RepID=A0A5Q0M951_VARPD|nr:AMP-binding protein [Variovorax paradoxus]QFZ85164.1 AMP-binding protein [Variovorax paradoxus]
MTVSRSNVPATFGGVVLQQARFGAKIAFADTQRSVTFAQFSERVDRLADSFFRLGLKPGARIGILSRNCVSAVECVAVMKAGFVPVPLNWRLTPPELASLLRDCKPDALVCDEQGAKIADEEILPHVAIPHRIAFGSSRAGWLDFEAFLGAGVADAIHPAAAEDATALLIYTSGTTAAPKAAMISHKGLVANALASASEAIGVSEDDTVLFVMPLFHVGGLCYYLLASYMAGASCVLRPMFEVSDLVTSIERLGVTNVHLVPTMISDLVGHPGAAQAASKLRRIVYAGSAMPVALLERAMAAFGNCSFSQSYGSTEGGIITALGPAEHRMAATQPDKAHLLRSCGQLLSGTDLRIVDPDGGDCRNGSPGEVLVRSARTMSGYWASPEKTRDTFVGEHLRTGDIGYRDADGYLYLVDRKNDMIVTGGENVFPSEVEQVLYRSPDVAEAAVFGVPDPRWIEKVAAAVVLREGSRATPESLLAFCKAHLAPYKCPKSVLVMEQLPKTGVGKISRKLLQQAVVHAANDAKT